MIRKALVTGGNRGIGRAIAAGLAAQGLDVVIGARDPQAGQVAADALGVRAVHLDLTHIESVRDAVAAEGGFDIVVNNAGVLDGGGLLADPGPYQTAMQVMVHGPYHLIRANVAHMRGQGWGRIVNLSSGWGAFSEGLDGPGAYAVAKASLNALTLALSHELPDTIKINAMCPGWVRTRMGGPGASRSPEEGADTAVWLATLPEDGPTGGFFRDRKPIAW
ncbi:SDR family NAD(P)-dependent oxidoreductase [Rhodobacteraceae bacterium 2CG4]|uniref:SDR family NAD(P)-dependent oxidoreductase n=1 Tax=Halovulum marinum TaxID=2662447 RepID=A0A6L5YZX0_9RHOB|nr:SDR family NAD(P)-dependent oxidoreductase [Halovulum marinum]MSU89807.1 SDR family NAD(P)-dependent oxidoreductase [Halovulum marinum]